MTFEDAAAVPDGAYRGCWQCGRGMSGKASVSSCTARPGHRGTACVQLARYYGAHVTAVCNTKNVDLMRSLGADEVIDYTREDFAPKGQAYDVFIDAVGKRRSFLRNRRFLEPGGVVRADRRAAGHRLGAAGVEFGKRRMRFDYSRPRRMTCCSSSSSSRRGTTGRSSTRLPLGPAVDAHAMSTPGRKPETSFSWLPRERTRRHEAVVHDRYGPPEVLSIREVEDPLRSRTKSARGSTPRP